VKGKITAMLVAKEITQLGFELRANYMTEILVLNRGDPMYAAHGIGTTLHRPVS